MNQSTVNVEPLHRGLIIKPDAVDYDQLRLSELRAAAVEPRWSARSYHLMRANWFVKLRDTCVRAEATVVDTNGIQ
jgi:hypothetical protein